MRSVSLEELKEHNPELVADVEAGQRITLVRGGRTVATIEPKTANEDEAFVSYENATEVQREAARERLFAMMDKGYDFKGYRFNRDELYDDDF